MKRSREPEEQLSSPSSSPPAPATVGTVDNHLATGSATPCEISKIKKHNSADADVGLPCAKIASLDPGHSDADGTAEPTMICLLHRERVDFPSYGAYESHYNKEHLNRCLECHRNFPSPLYLSLHADEWHDPFVAVKRDKGEHTYACFVEGCERKCGSAEKRRRHLIDKHSYPKNFFYAITQYGVDGRQSLLEDGGWRQQQHYHRRRRSSLSATKKDTRRHQGAGSISKSDDTSATATLEATLASARPVDDKDGQEDSDADEDGKDQATDTDTDERSDVEMDDLAGALSAMTFVPRGVRFGRGGKVGFSRRL